MSSVGEQVMLEILVRMRGNDGQLIVPNAFIPNAERHGLSSTIDRWVIENILALYRAGAMFDSAGEEIAVAINLSAASLLDDDFLAYVGRNLAASDVPAHLIGFEIDETTAVSNLSKVSQLMAQWRQWGSRFTLEDFGGGLASINYLQTLPIDFIKIDGTLLQGLPENSVNRTVINAINELAHLTEKQTIAGYIESDAVRLALDEIGVDFGQGWAISKPLPLHSWRYNAAFATKTGNA